ncbi:MAG: hypothetical protein H5U40_19000 [Polyangiaceae bacterium]|nr:hypothetical protein [Polyangiaceae bacterium]
MIVVSLASASSAALVALIASQRMLAPSYVVGFAAITAGTHAWAVTCVGTSSSAPHLFALSAIVGSLVFDRPRHLTVFLAALWAAFAVSIPIADARELLPNGLELLVVSAIALCVAAARARHRDA